MEYFTDEPDLFLQLGSVGGDVYREIFSTAATAAEMGVDIITPIRVKRPAVQSSSVDIIDSLNE